ncbi:hypothetical protein HDV63DRAFT_176639 [Trichoderma sp. SZMC 28014]
MSKTVAISFDPMVGARRRCPMEAAAASPIAATTSIVIHYVFSFGYFPWLVGIFVFVLLLSIQIRLAAKYMYRYMLQAKAIHMA